MCRNDVKSACISAEISFQRCSDWKPITSSPIREPRDCQTLLERVDSEIRIIVADFGDDRNIGGRPDEAACNAMKVYFGTDDTWGGIGSKKCHAKAHLIVLLGIVLGEIKWDGGQGRDLTALSGIMNCIDKQW